MPKCIVPEHGKRYMTAEGFITPPMQWDAEEKKWRAGTQWWKDTYFDVDREAAPGDPVAEYTGDLPHWRYNTDSDDQPLLEWQFGTPTDDEFQNCWIVEGTSGDVPDPNDLYTYAPNSIKASVWLGSKRWYLVLRVKPVERPKQTVTLRKWVLNWSVKSYCEMWLQEGEIPYEAYIRTDETKTVELESDDVRSEWRDKYYVSSTGRFMDGSVYLVRNSPTSFYAMLSTQTKGVVKEWTRQHDEFVRSGDWKEITLEEANELMRAAVGGE